MKRILILCTSILLATVLGSSFFCNALAETKMTCVKVIEGGASLRSYPDGQKIGGVQQNAVLDVVDQDGSWLYVYYNGQYGWISKGRTEVVATEGKASLVRIRIIDVETMKGEYLNNSTITNSSMLDDLNAGRLIGESMSTTRVDGADDEEPYPLMDTYYYVVGDKATLAHERSVKLVLKKDQRQEYQIELSRGFSWAKPEDLVRLLKFFQ